MAERKVIRFPMKPTKSDEANVAWMFYVANQFSDDCSYQYHRDGQFWTVVIKSSTILRAVALAEQCRRVLGWEQKPPISEIQVKEVRHG